HHFEAVVVGRVVAAGIGNAGTRLTYMGAKIHQRSGYGADVQCMDVAIVQATLQRAGKVRAAVAAVASHYQRVNPFFGGALGERQAEAVGESRIELRWHDASDVVSLENGVWQCGSRHSDFLYADCRS